MARGRRATLARLGASRVLLLLAQMGAGLPGTPPLLRLRGGGGVFEGELSEAHGLGRVSETLMMRERLGANCGDVANVPPDITSHHHLDSLAPQSLFEVSRHSLPGTQEREVVVCSRGRGYTAVFRLFTQ